MAAAAVVPSIEGFVGTSRQPRTVTPSWAAMSSSVAAALAASSGSAGRKAIPVAY
jgi:hypothetical protein